MCSQQSVEMKWNVWYFVTWEMEHRKVGLGQCKCFPVPEGDGIVTNTANPKSTHTPDNLRTPQARKEDLT